MKFETAYKIMELAEVTTAYIFWNGRGSSEPGIDIQAQWEYALEDIPYFVNLFDVPFVHITRDYHSDQEIAGNTAQLFIYLDSDQTAQHWERIRKLA